MSVIVSCNWTIENLLICLLYCEKPWIFILACSGLRISLNILQIPFNSSSTWRNVLRYSYIQAFETYSVPRSQIAYPWNGPQEAWIHDDHVIQLYELTTVPRVRFFLAKYFLGLKNGLFHYKAVYLHHVRYLCVCFFKSLAINSKIPKSSFVVHWIKYVILAALFSFMIMIWYDLLLNAG